MVAERGPAHVVDRLKDSLAGLEPPTCVNCRVEMRWIMSTLVRQSSASTILHRFVCPRCEGVEDVETEFKPIRVLPENPTKPREAANAA